MAQIGCFVPAEFTMIRVCDQLFSRIGSECNYSNTDSTFTLEVHAYGATKLDAMISQSYLYSYFLIITYAIDYCNSNQFIFYILGYTWAGLESDVENMETTYSPSVRPSLIVWCTAWSRHMGEKYAGILVYNLKLKGICLSSC